MYKQYRSVVSPGSHSENKVFCASQHLEEEYMVEPIHVGIRPVLSYDAD